MPFSQLAIAKEVSNSDFSNEVVSVKQQMDHTDCELNKFRSFPSSVYVGCGRAT